MSTCAERLFLKPGTCFSPLGRGAYIPIYSVSKSKSIDAISLWHACHKSKPYWLLISAQAPTAVGKVRVVRFIARYDFADSAATVPAGFTKDGLPVGLQIVGRHLDDATVLKAAAAYEAAAPWKDKWPPMLQQLNL